MLQKTKSSEKSARDIRTLVNLTTLPVTTLPIQWNWIFFFSLSLSLKVWRFSTSPNNGLKASTSPTLDAGYLLSSPSSCSVFLSLPTRPSCGCYKPTDYHLLHFTLLLRPFSLRLHPTSDILCDTHQKTSGRGCGRHWASCTVICWELSVQPLLLWLRLTCSGVSWLRAALLN